MIKPTKVASPCERLLGNEQERAQRDVVIMDICMRRKGTSLSVRSLSEYVSSRNFRHNEQAVRKIECVHVYSCR